MLEIRKNDEVMLDQKYHESNNILANLYDFAIEVLKDPYYNDVRVTNISFDQNSDLKKAFQSTGSNALDILKTHGKRDVLDTVLTKNIALAVGADALNFIYEAIDNAKKGKMSVAFALLRKPFTDELLILEQLFINKSDFINRFFHNGNIDEYDPSKITQLEKKTIIESSVLKLNSSIYDANIIYDLRYNKSKGKGINGVSNQALHIVTNDPKYCTNKQSLNFVFSVKEDLDEYWEHFYFAVPLLIIYLTAIIDGIFFQFIDDKEERLVLKNFKRILSYVMVYSKNKKNELFYDALASCFDIECSMCKNQIKFIKADFDLFFYENIFLCSKCFNLQKFSKQLFEKVNRLFVKV